MNGLANALPINGKTTGEISDGFDILFTPAGYVFSIWGLIYLALIAFTVVQALPSQRTNPVLEEVRPLYLLSAAANAGWILAWHHEEFVLSLALMLIILGSLIAVRVKLARGATREGVVGGLVRATFSLYLGWISIAAIANTTVVLWTWGYSAALASPTVTLAILAFASSICAYVSLRFADPVYAGVFVWALVGIGLKHAGVESLYSLHLGAFGLAIVCMIVLGTSIVLAFRRGSTAPPAASDFESPQCRNPASALPNV